MAVVTGAPGPGPVFVFSFRAVFQTHHRSERLIRLALNRDAGETEVPHEASAPLRSVGPIAPWLDDLRRLLSAASRAAREQASREGGLVEADAQRHLYRIQRRLAALYSGYRTTSLERDEIAAEYRRRLSEELDRHRLRITLSLIAVTVALPARER